MEIKESNHMKASNSWSIFAKRIFNRIFNLKLLIMRKKILCIIAVSAVGAIATFNLNLGSKSSDMSDVSLTNVEAIASECTTSSNSSENTGTCEKRTDGDGDSCVAPDFWDSKNCNGQV
jgi:hypothetical protein